MKCEFCGETISDNSFSCPNCGSLVRNTLSEKNNTVISIEQQIEIGNYKSSREYKIPKDETNDDPYSYSDISRKPFASQKISSEKNESSNHPKRDVLIKDDNTSTSANSLNNKSYTMQKSNIGEVVIQSNTPNGKASSKKKRVNLSKKKNKVNLSKEIHNPTNADNFINLTDNSASPEILDGCVDIQPGLTKNQLMSLHNLHSVRIPYYSSVLCFYFTLVYMTYNLFSNMSLYIIINIFLVMGLTFGIQFKYNYSCAVGCIVFGVVYSVTGILFFNTLAGLFIVLGGILAERSIKNFNNLWTQYQETGRLPLNP